MLYCVGIKVSGIDEDGVLIYRDTDVLGSYVIEIFDDVDFSLECVTADYLFKCCDLGVSIDGVKLFGKIGLNINVTKPLFATHIQRVSRDYVSGRTGFLNKDFSRKTGMQYNCRVFLSGYTDFYLDAGRLISSHSGFKPNYPIDEDYLRKKYKGAIRCHLSDKIPAILNVTPKLLVEIVYRDTSNSLTVFDVIDYLYSGKEIAFASLDGNKLTIDTPTEKFVYNVSNELLTRLMKCKMAGLDITGR